jgi:hypothetical protein
MHNLLNVAHLGAPIVVLSRAIHDKVGALPNCPCSRRLDVRRAHGELYPAGAFLPQEAE